MRFRKLTFLKVAASLVLAAALLLGAWVAQPLPQGLLDLRPVASVRVVDRNGLFIRELPTQQGRSIALSEEAIPPHFAHAILAAEDAGFYGHMGISPTAIVRSLWLNMRARKVVAGGSTLSQQLARKLVPRKKTFGGKLKEALWALRLEAHTSKKHLLMQYANRVEFGNQTVGLEAASLLYFGRRAQHLSVAQAALLAAIPRSPTAYNPYNHLPKLKQRQLWVLKRMLANAFITAEEWHVAQEAPLDFSSFLTAFEAPHFVEEVMGGLEALKLKDAVVLETTLDLALQKQVEEIIGQELQKLSDRKVSSAAVLVVENATSEILAYVGSKDFFDEEILGQNNGIRMLRQPGSLLKPFVYLQALESERFTAASVLPDVERDFGAPKGPYKPKNYNKKTHGPIRLREALASSYNIPAVFIAEALGASTVLMGLHKAGFHSLSRDFAYYGLGLALGNGEVSLWEVVQAYAGLSRGGLLLPLQAVRRGIRVSGEEVFPSVDMRPQRFAREEAVALLTDVLSDNGARVSAFGLENALRFSFPVAAKTGTSKGYSDNWTAGYTREYTVAVWAGNFDGSSMQGISGISGAAPIFRRVFSLLMSKAVPSLLSRTHLLSQRSICPLSGQLPGEQCTAVAEEWFIPGTEPLEHCAIHVGLSPTLPEHLAEKCIALERRMGGLKDFGVAFSHWAQESGWISELHLLEHCKAERADAELRVSRETKDIQLLMPKEGDEFRVIGDLPADAQMIPIRIQARGVEELEVFVDGHWVLTMAMPFSGRIPAQVGAHMLSIRKKGAPEELVRANFVVRKSDL
ncbi:MAG: penicillin-binding protein 1C [Cystobacterineae bacterium]|nr:penicillin-binding protein 1C [Cystobacterineae bacterium]